MSWIALNLQNKHCFFGSEGGVSQGVFAGLNISPKGCDSKEELEQNLEIAAQYFGLHRQNFALLNQGVSNKVFYIDKPTFLEFDGDGMVTDKPNIILGLRTADCAPVLLEDKEKGVIGAAHAGWRGAFKGVIENTIDLMLQKGAKRQNIAAAVGPCIAQESYEVDDSFYEVFLQKKEEYRSYFLTKNKGHYLFDLEKFCVDRLQESGIEKVSCAHHDTYQKEQEYYSFRRFTHRGLVKENGGFAAQMSAIVLRK